MTLYTEPKIIADSELNGEHAYSKFEDRVRYTWMMMRKPAHELTILIAGHKDKMQRAFAEGWHSDEVIEEIFGVGIPKDLRG